MNSDALTLPAQVLVVFARAPEPGQVKTRLAAALGPHAAAALYAAMLQDCLALAQNSTAQNATALQRCALLAYTPRTAFADGPHSLRRFWQGQRLPQPEGDLGQKLAGVIEEVFSQGAQRLVIIGSDSPDLPPQFIDDAFAALARHDLVFGPAHDGGFYLMGVRQPAAALLQNVPWSAPNTLQSILENSRALRLSHALLPAWHDVDTVEDLQRLRASAKATLAQWRECQRF